MVKGREKVKKVTNRLDIVMSQMDTLRSLYTDVLACRAPAKNYAFFFMERYLQLKIKAVKAGVPIELKTIDDFINYCKHYGVKVQRYVSYICIILCWMVKRKRTLVLLWVIFSFRHSSLLLLTR